MHRWSVQSTPEAAARVAAQRIAEAVQRSVQEHGGAQIALSGGSNVSLLTALAAEHLPWSALTIHQVDERVAPSGDAARNLVHLLEALPAHAHVRPMPVEDPELGAAAEHYARELPHAFDVIQLGIGDDGHTASLVPGDPVLDVTDQAVAVTGEYRGHRRMTLTYPVLNQARLVVWVATGPAKRGPLEQLMAGDGRIPAARVRAPDQLVVCDVAAAPSVIWSPTNPDESEPGAAG